MPDTFTGDDASSMGLQGLCKRVEGDLGVADSGNALTDEVSAEQGLEFGDMSLGREEQAGTHALKGLAGEIAASDSLEGNYRGQFGQEQSISS